MKVFFTFGVIFLFTSNVLSLGQSGAEFLKIFPGVKSASLGGAFVGLADNYEAIMTNPAGLTSQKKILLGGTHLFWFGRIQYDFLSYLHPLGRWGGIGCALSFLYARDTYRNELGVEEGRFLNYNLAFSLAYGGYVSRKLHSGIALKIISGQLADRKAATAAVDLGLLYHPFSWCSVGGVVQNLGPGLKYIEKRDPLPIIIKTGLAGKFCQKRLIFTFDTSYQEEGIKLHFGSELKLKITRASVVDSLVRAFSGGFISSAWANQVSLRAGYEKSFSSAALSALSFGFGGIFEGNQLRFKLDFVYSLYPNFYSNPLRIGLGVEF